MENQMKQQTEQRNKPNVQTWIAAALLAASAVLAVVSYLILPETVVTQISLGGGAATTMPKLAAIALPFALGAGGSAVSLAARDGNAKKKSLLVAAVGVLVFAIMLAVNA